MLQPAALSLLLVSLHPGEPEQWILLLQAEGSERVRADPFAAIEIDLSRLWAV